MEPVTCLIYSGINTQQFSFGIIFMISFRVMTHCMQLVYSQILNRIFFLNYLKLQRWTEHFTCLFLIQVRFLHNFTFTSVGLFRHHDSPGETAIRHLYIRMTIIYGTLNLKLYSFPKSYKIKYGFSGFCSQLFCRYTVIHGPYTVVSS